ncbi:acetoin dehydrogenase dihydrolipoyllysine-residue acetyltransferase subunit [Inquilinus sp. CAU 1745]|uniref:acetoin dehydrogenase dihydrolipoyllysine-residue acetyltransferase subunit n=1 Tax=Inquilinus sp. CAU 1745 TaxID=3140369 RepID=UPI00325B3ED7
MAAVTLTMPRLGETMEQGRVVGWLVQAGDSFKRGEAILEIETDKTVAELPALGDGRLDEMLAAVGDEVPVGEPLARIDAVDKDEWAGGAPEETTVQPSTGPSPMSPVAAKTSGGRVRATPVARRLAQRHDIDIGNLAGSGRRGRIEKNDVMAAVDQSPVRVGDDESIALPEGRIAFTRHGAPERGKGTVILLHGFSGDRMTWSSLASSLARAGRHVIAPDLPGHGATEIEAGTVDALRAPLPAFVDALDLGDGPLEVVGHSLGALAALRLADALGTRVRRLTLLAPVGLGPEIDRDFLLGMATARTPDAVAHLLRRLTVNASLPSPDALRALADSLGQGRLVDLAHALVGAHAQQVDMVEALGRAVERTSVRVIFGLEDRIIPWRQVAAAPSAVAIHLVGGAGHMPHWDKPAEVLRIVDPGS